MRLALMLIALGTALLQGETSRASIENPVCLRTPQVRAVLTQILDRPCFLIGPDSLASVTELDLASYATSEPLTALKQSDLAGLVNLQSLTLTSQPLTELPEGLFADLGQLQELNMANMKLTHLEPGVFRGLNSLLFLSMVRNELTELHPELLTDTPQLRELLLQQNKLQTIPSQIVEGVHSRVYLKGNPIEENVRTELQTQFGPKVDFSVGP